MRLVEVPESGPAVEVRVADLPRDARFVTAVDGFSSRPDILSSETIAEMTAPPLRNP